MSSADGVPLSHPLLVLVSLSPLLRQESKWFALNPELLSQGTPHSKPLSSPPPPPHPRASNVKYRISTRALKSPSQFFLPANALDPRKLAHTLGGQVKTVSAGFYHYTCLETRVESADAGQRRDPGKERSGTGLQLLRITLGSSPTRAGSSALSSHCPLREPAWEEDEAGGKSSGWERGRQANPEVSAGPLGCSHCIAQLPAEGCSSYVNTG